MLISKDNSNFGAFPVVNTNTNIRRHCTTDLYCTLCNFGSTLLEAVPVSPQILPPMAALTLPPDLPSTTLATVRAELSKSTVGVPTPAADRHFRVHSCKTWADAYCNGSCSGGGGGCGGGGGGRRHGSERNAETMVAVGCAVICNRATSVLSTAAK